MSTKPTPKPEFHTVLLCETQDNDDTCIDLEFNTGEEEEDCTIHIHLDHGEKQFQFPSSTVISVPQLHNDTDLYNQNVEPLITKAFETQKDLVVLTTGQGLAPTYRSMFGGLDQDEQMDDEQEEADDAETKCGFEKWSFDVKDHYEYHPQLLREINTILLMHFRDSYEEEGDDFMFLWNMLPIEVVERIIGELSEFYVGDGNGMIRRAGWDLMARKGDDVDISMSSVLFDGTGIVNLLDGEEENQQEKESSSSKGKGKKKQLKELKVGKLGRKVVIAGVKPRPVNAVRNIQCRTSNRVINSVG
eukprot:TRINITY_DN1031_c0_g1_i1.p1 TRINITY_DN1031_c0_g1~~TRINITY_DN1031_c0_g1_i1.p1  ORF type:complete len:316 (+),score=115.20 TRINITY_DN1031_c0_g1_i1:40-948(+)